MFLGEHAHTLDDKGRVILPARFRSELVGGIVLTVAKDRCVDVFPRAEFERRVELLAAEVEAGTAHRSDLRLFTANAYEQVPDGQGRVTIPPKLREYASLDRDLSVNGMHRYIEIWDRATWSSYESGATNRFAEDGAA